MVIPPSDAAGKKQSDWNDLEKRNPGEPEALAPGVTNLLRY